jgi:hypothetical protein
MMTIRTAMTIAAILRGTATASQPSDAELEGQREQVEQALKALGLNNKRHRVRLRLRSSS